MGLAARLEAAAAPGQILVGEDTARRCGAYFDLVDLGPRTLRGPRRAGEGARAGGRGGASRAPLRRARAGPHALRGARRPSSSRLRRALAAGGALRCVEVRGEVGVGKSRLVHECLLRAPRGGARARARAVASRAPSAPTCRGSSCCGAGRRTSRAPSRRRFSSRPSRAAARPTPIPRRSPPRVRSLLGGAAREGARRRLRSTTPSGSTPLPRRSWGGCRPIRREGSLSLRRHAPQRRGRPTWGAAGPVERIDVGPLSLAESRTARRTRSSPASTTRADLVELACLRGGGNPLFVEEVARALRDGSDSARDAARLEVSLGRARERIPETLHAVVASRIDALPPSAKRPARGGRGAGRALRAGARSPRWSRGSRRAPRASSRSSWPAASWRATPGGEHDFCHGVVRSGAYAQLVRERRTSPASPPRGRAREAAARREPRRRLPHRPPLRPRRRGRTRRAATCSARDAATPTLRALPEAVLHLRRAFALARESGVRRIRRSPPRWASVSRRRSRLSTAAERPPRCSRASTSSALRSATGCPSPWRRSRRAGCASRTRATCARGRSLVERGLRLAEALGGSEDVAAARPHLPLAHRAARRRARAGPRARAERAIELAAARGDATSAGGRPPERVRRALRGGAPCRGPGERRPRRCAARVIADSDVPLGMAHVALARVALLAGDVEGALAAAARADEAGDSLGPGRASATTRRWSRATPISSRRAARGARRLRGPRGAERPLAEHLAASRAGQARDRRPREPPPSSRRAASPPGAPRTIAARALAVRGLALGLGAGRRDEADALLAEALELCDALGLRPALAETAGLPRRGRRAPRRRRARRALRRARRRGVRALRHGAPRRPRAAPAQRSCFLISSSFCLK